MVPLEIVFEGLAPDEAIRTRIEEEAGRLEKFHGRITRLAIVIEGPSKRRHKGGTYGVRLHLTMPGHREVNISRDPGRNHAHEDLGVTIRDAFKAARRRLQDRVRRQRGEVKVHEPAPNGTIARLIAEQDYGFIAAADGREVYFHRNSVANGKFEALQVGEKVRFVEAMGEKGPQATYVAPAGRSAPAASRGKAGGGA